LRARGDVTVAIAWSKGEADKVVLWTGHGGPLVLRSDIFADAYAVTDAAGRAVATTHSKNGIVIQTQSGEKYTLQRLSKNTQKI
jgi:alpha-L-fucosidase 2